MYKEIVITTIIIILIIIGNIITQNNTNKSVETISSELSMFRQNIIKENVDKEAVEKHIEKIENIWNEQYEKMAYYIEHDELEKVETELAKLKADIEVKNYLLAVENIDNCVFILEHIKDKTALKIVNIF